MTNIELPNNLGTLRPTLRAAKEVNATFGSFMEAIRRLETVDFSAFVAIVAAGLGKKRSDVEDDVYAVGMPDLTQPLSEYVTLLANGGRPIKAPSKDDAPEGEA